MIGKLLADWQEEYARSFDPTLIVECDQTWNFRNLLDFAYRCVYAPDDFLGIYSDDDFAPFNPNECKGDNTCIENCKKRNCFCGQVD